MRIDYKKLNKEVRMEKTNGIVKFFMKNGKKFELDNYESLDNEERLDLLAETGETIDPGYRVKFKKLEDRKPEDNRIELESDFTLQEVMESAKGIPITEKALEIFYSNRIAHTCRDAQKKMLSDLLDNLKDTYKDFNSLEYEFTPKELNQTTQTLHRYFIAEKTKNINAKKIAKAQLGRKLIGDEEIEELRKRGFDVLSKGYIDCMSIKDAAIAESIELLKDDETQSFGLSRQKNKKTGKIEDFFVIDVQGYGQMSVHIYDPELISSLSEHEYTYPIYQVDNILLFERTSKYQESFYRLENDEEVVKKLKEIGPNADTHEVAVKGMLTKQQMDIIYGKTNDEEDGR